MRPLPRIRLAVASAAAVAVSLALVPAAEAYIYWGQEAYGKGVGRAGLDGGGVDHGFVPGPSGQYARAMGVAANGSNIFWGANLVDGNPGARVGRSGPAGSDYNHSFTAGSGNVITGMAASPTHLYWTSDNQDTSNVTQSPIGGGQASQTMTSRFGSGHPHACGVAVDDTYVYWANKEHSKISRAELANFGQAGQVIEENFILLGTGVLPCGIAVDDTHVYWGIHRTGGINGPKGTTLGRANKSDGSAATNAFVGGGNMVTGVALDDDFIYWANNDGYSRNGGSIGRASKDGTGVDGTFVSGLNSPWGVAVDGHGPVAAAPTPTPPQLPNPPEPLAVFQPGDGFTPPGTPRFGTVGVRDDVWAPSKKNTPLNGDTARAVPRGTVFSFVLDTAATVKVAIQRRTAGRKVGRRCRAPSRRLRRKSRCARFATQVTLTRRARAGLNKVPFTGRVRGRALKPGSYRAVFTAKAAGAPRSEATRVRFRIVRP